MDKSLFFTGYPGFLASYLVRQLFDDHGKNIAHVHLLVLPNEYKKAEERIKYLVQTANLSIDQFTIIKGDITKENLGIAESLQRQLCKEVTHVFHLAAIYDLAVPKHIANFVNIDGTKRVNDWVQTLENIERYTYFSTAYVSGTREGRIYEHELVEGQMFRNHYERTKYKAEILVEKLKNKVPTTIIRPGIVTGNSETGETIKFDGLYFMLNLYERIKWIPVLPSLTDGKSSPEGNFVPSDYVLKATSYLAMNEIGEGHTYHLTNPNPSTMNDIQNEISMAYLGRRIKGKLPVALMKVILEIYPIRKWLQVEAEVTDYFTIYSSYDTSRAELHLQEANISCPDFKDTLIPMITFYRKYKDDQQKHIEIL